MDRLLEWRERLARNKRIVAFTADCLCGQRFVVAVCRNRRAANSLLRDLHADDFPGAALRSANTVWLVTEGEPPPLPGRHYSVK